MKPTSNPCRLLVRIADDALGIEKVAGVLRRRGHRVQSLRVERGADGTSLSMALEVTAAGDRPERVVAELEKLSCVLTVAPGE